MSTMTVSAKGWVVIPKEYREKYHLTPGVEVEIVDYGGGLYIVERRRGKEMVTTYRMDARARKLATQQFQHVGNVIGQFVGEKPGATAE